MRKRSIPFGGLAAALCLALCLAAPARADEGSPATAAALEAHVGDLASRVSPAFVFIGGGSGVLISADGYVLTNHHVAGSQDQWSVYLTGGRAYTARVVGRDAFGDICLLKLENAEGLPHVAFGDSDALATGEYVVAVGNPFLLGNTDFQPTVTLGVVSAIHRYQTNYSDAIQTDASINPGNSGGPLFNMRGELVGINGQILFRYGTKVNTGVGFAISSAQIERFLPLLREAAGADVAHGTLAGCAFDPDWSNGQGARLARVTPGSKAHGAGLRTGDWIVAVEGHAVGNARRAEGHILSWPGGSKISLTVRRDGEAVEVEVELDEHRPRGLFAGGGERPDRGQRRPGRPRVRLGVRLSAEGMKVESIVDGSAAAASGLRPGDVIKRFGETDLEDLNDLRAALVEVAPGDEVAAIVERDGKEIGILIAFPD